MGMKFLSHLMKLLHLMTLPSQQFCLCGTLFNVHDTLMKHALRLALGQRHGLQSLTFDSLSFYKNIYQKWYIYTFMKLFFKKNLFIWSSKQKNI